MKKTLLVLSFILIGVFFAHAQDVVNIKLLKSYTKEQIKDINPLIKAEYSVDVYYLEYTTKKINSKKDTASGIFSIPLDKESKFPVLMYEHGTANDRNSVPSKDDNQVLSAVIGSYGYVCVFPDYIGLGISGGLHPYLHPESEAWASIDMMKAVKKLEASNLVRFNEQVFVTGYSQGGHSAMATSKGLQDIGVNVTASAPMSGPYSVSKEMKSFTLSDNEYYFCGYLGSVFLSAKYVYPDILSELTVDNVFKPGFAKIINSFAIEEIDLSTMNNKMLDLLAKEGGKVIPNRMFRDDVKQKIIKDADFPLNKALKKMDVCNWVPKFPLKMIYCKADNQVTYRNAVYTDSLMKANGAEFVSSDDVFPTGDHSSCFTFALIRMIDFFGKYQNVITSVAQNPDFANIVFYPNPGSDILYFDTPVGIDKIDKVKIISLEGKVVFEVELKESGNGIDISKLNKGLYTIMVTDGHTTKAQKLIIQ